MQPVHDSLKATVISMFPLEIAEVKPALYPGYFVLPAAPFGDFTYLVVGDAIFYQETKNEIVTQVRTAFNVLAESIVHDFQSSHLGRVPGIAEPGLFWIPGAYNSKIQIKELFQDELDKCERRQNEWFKQLVEIADDTFGRTNRHTSVSALQRLAATRLAVSRPWVLRTGDSSNTCRFCKAETPYGAVKCPNCREILDIQAYMEMKKDYPQDVQEVR